jgi:hypothetical protein
MSAKCWAILLASLTVSNMLSRRTLLLLSLLCTTCPWASVANERAQVTLKVKPLLCVTDRVTPSCDMAFLVRWFSESPGNYCLSSDLQTAPLRCWDEASLGEANERRRVTAPFAYWLSLPGSTERLASTQIEVLRLDAGDRKRQRRTRHVWDIL